MEISTCIKAVRVAANQFNNNRSSSNMNYLIDQLEVLQTVSARSESLKPLQPKEIVTFDCLGCLTDIINNASNKAALVLQCLHIFTNLVQDCCHFNSAETGQRLILSKCTHFSKTFAKDIQLCNIMKEAFNLDHVLAGVIKTFGGSPDEELSQVCLRLLQKVTYGHRISFHESYVDDLVRYLVAQVLSQPSVVTKSCLGVLTNLCRDNFPIQARIRSMDNFQRLCKTLCKYFSSEDMTTAIFALAVYQSLAQTEEMRDQVFFNSQNFKRILQIVFKILVNSKDQTARNYTVDLFQDMIRNPRLQQALEEYCQLLPKCVEDILHLLAASSVHSVGKIFELLISFCTVGSLRSCLCQHLFHGPFPSDTQLAEMLNKHPRPGCHPLAAIVYWASSSCKASVAALDFLKEMYEEFLCSDDQGLQNGIGLVLPVLVQILREPISPDSSFIKDACHKLSGALRLLTEDEMKASVAESVKTQDFVAIMQFQLASNIGAQRQAFKCADPDEDWGSAGVEVILLSMQLMGKVQRYIDGLEDFFVQLLQDNQMVPFLAKGWTSQNRDLVQISLQLTRQGSALENFPDVILGDAVAAANNTKAASAVPSRSSETALEVSRSSCHSFAYYTKENMPPSSPNIGNLSLQSVKSEDNPMHSIIEKLHTSIELKDLKTPDVIEIYEHRLQSHQTKEDHLQDLMEAKSMALAQADRLIAQYRSRQARHGAEAHKMRCLFQEAEKKNEGLLQEMNELKLDKDRLKNEYDLLKHERNQLELKSMELEELKSAHCELSNKHEELESSLTRQQQELKTTQEMHEMLQKHYESLKHQHDVASEQLKKLEDERKQLSRTLKEKESKLRETSTSLQTLTDKHNRSVKDKEELEAEKETLDECVDKMRKNISSLEQAKRELQQRVKSLEKLNLSQDEALKSYQDKVQHLETEVSKHAQIAQLIHSLSSGQAPAPANIPVEK